MSAAVFGIALRLRRRSVALAGFGLFAMILMVGALFPAVGDSFGELNAPEGVSNLLGGADYGPELTATVLREWCRHGSTDTAYIEPGSPWQNPYVESFNDRRRDELLNVEVFTCLDEARCSPPTGGPTTTPTIPTRRLA